MPKMSVLALALVKHFGKVRLLLESSSGVQKFSGVCGGVGIELLMFEPDEDSIEEDDRQDGTIARV